VFDSHCHLHDARIADADALIARARRAGVAGFLLAGVDPASWPDEEALAGRHPDVCFSVGVHPQVVDQGDDAAAARMVEALAARLDDAARLRPAALGETGLDLRGPRRASRARQERAFRDQLALARAHRLPLVLHVLEAHARVLELLDEEGVAAGGVVHAYSGPAELVPRYLAHGLAISFAGSVANPAARRVHAAARAVPDAHLLVETDAPDQTPLARRPAPNEPAFLTDVVAALAELRGATPAAIAALTAANARRFFIACTRR
jgi:TatD DNase family protein